MTRFFATRHYLMGVALLFGGKLFPGAYDAASEGSILVDITEISIDVTARPARSITAYHLFRDVAKQIPNDGLIPYDINAPLFTDYAEKHRFLYLPPGMQVTYQKEGVFSFPVGTVLIKTFSQFLDRRSPEKGARILETRLLMHRPEGWVGYPYVWNEDLSDARLSVAGARIPIDWIHDDGTSREAVYSVPNKNECNYCHENNDVMGPIGLKARQMNRSIESVSGAVNQLTAWMRDGILTGAPAKLDDVPMMPSWSSESSALELRARAYLDGNCAHCHQPGGDAGPTGLDFSWYQKDPQAYGVNRKPTAAGPASRGYRVAIRPGEPDASLILSRMRATEPGRLMPRTGRSIPHAEGIALISAWIASMPATLDTPTFYADSEN